MSEEKKIALTGGAFLIEGPRLRVHLEAQLDSYVTSDGGLTFHLNITQSETISPEVRRNSKSMGGDLLSTYDVPPGTFDDDETRAEWETKARTFFTRRLVETMIYEASAHLADAGNFYLDEMGIDPAPVPRKELVEIHLNQTRARVSHYLGVKGQRSRWTRAELRRAVLAALSSGGPHTLAAVARQLQRSHARKAPASGEALGVLLKRFKLSWKELKAGEKTDS